MSNSSDMESLTVPTTLDSLARISDFIMDATQAKEYGIVDQVISRRER